MSDDLGGMDVHVARPESGTQSPIGRAPQQSIAADLSAARTAARPQPSVRAAAAAAGDRFLLARPSAPRRSPGAGAGRQERGARQLDLAPRREAQERFAGYVPDPAGALSRNPIFPRARFLLRLRSTGFPFRLACRSVGQRPEQERHLALRLRDRLAVLERSERRSAAAAPPAGAALRRRWRALMEIRRDRPPRAAVPGVERASRHAVAGAARFLGLAEPAGDQSRRSRGQMRQRGARPQCGAADDVDYTMISPRLML